MRFTLQDYQTAIENLRLGMTQLEPDGNECAICGDGGHQAMECGRNPLLAQECCVTIAKQSEALHETLHALAGYNTCMGQTTGPAAIIAHNTWITDGTPPDSDTTVLAKDSSGNVGEAFHDGDAWRWASSALIRKVTSWADLPAGPKG